MAVRNDGSAPPDRVKSMHDPWRRRLDAVNEGRAPPPAVHSLPAPVEPRGARRLLVLAAIGTVASIALLVLGLILAFPLAWERKGNSCSALESLLARQAYQWTPGAGAPAPVLTMMPNAEMPAWFRCHVIYWRRLEVGPVGSERFLRLVRGGAGTPAAYFAGSGLLLGLVVLVTSIRRRRRAAARGEDAFGVLGIDSATVAQRAAPPPVDLARPITGETAWKAMRTHAKDVAYRQAVETLRLRYQLVGNQMLLPNTLREVMARSGVSFREAVIRVAKDDGIGGRR